MNNIIKKEFEFKENNKKEIMKNYLTINGQEYGSYN